MKHGWIVADHEVDIDGYELIRKDRNRNGGGVAIYVRGSINYKVRVDLMPRELEIITVEILKPRAKSFLINSWYRPADAPLEVFDEYETCLQTMDLEDLESFQQVISTAIAFVKMRKFKQKELVELTETLQLQQIITVPTRITENSQALIDLFFTDRPRNIIKPGVDHIGISDHFFMYIHRKISIPRNKPKVIHTRQFKHYNLEAFRYDLIQVLQTIPNVFDPNFYGTIGKQNFLL